MNNMKHKINLVGHNFIHLTDGNKGYSVNRKESEYIEWVHDFSATETVYIDDNIYKAFNDNISVIKYGWILESPFLTTHLVENIKQNIELFFSVFKYIFTHDKELIALDNRFKFVPGMGSWIKNPKIYQKNKLLSMISSDKTISSGHSNRVNWVNRLRNDLDLYGKGYNEIDSKEEGLCDYMFSITIENICKESYFTEKILDCFATGTIPVYLGTPDIDKFFNIDGIILLTDNFKVSDLSSELYYSKMTAIEDNLHRMKQMYPDSLEDYIYMNYLVLDS